MQTRATLAVHLDRLSANIDQLRKIAPQNEIIFMVKANAYGHGMLKVSEFSHFEKGINEFGVATLSEALELRNSLSDGKFEVIVFSDTQIQDEFQTYLDKRLIPVLSNYEDFLFFIKNSKSTSLPMYLKFNTGMNRLGIHWEKVDDVINELKKAGRKNVDHLMTHFACASLSMSQNMNKLQQERFANIKKAFSDNSISLVQTSIANSGAIEQKAGLEETHIRPGLMLYGPSSMVPKFKEKSCWRGSLISTLKTKIIRVYEVQKGTPIGYGASPVYDNGKVAVASIGYGDGFLTTYSGADIPYGNTQLRVFGRVNMDMIQLFNPDSSPVVDEVINLWSPDSMESFENLSHHSKLIPYEMFCSLGSRVPRIYSLE